jgi:predicted DNA binding CopG/RHH family protein
MKIFFTASLRGKDDFGSCFDTIYNEIDRLGYIHTDKIILDLNNVEYQQEYGENKESQFKIYKSSLGNMKLADMCVFEISNHDLDIGYLLNKSLELGKPTIAMYNVSYKPSFLLGMEDEKFILRGYTERNLKKVLREAVDAARERRDKRFNFFISPKLLEYLEKTSTRKGITKSKFIRNLITDHMRREKGPEDEEEDEGDFAL